MQHTMQGISRNVLTGREATPGKNIINESVKRKSDPGGIGWIGFGLRWGWPAIHHLIDLHPHVNYSRIRMIAHQPIHVLCRVFTE